MSSIFRFPLSKKPEPAEQRVAASPNQTRYVKAELAGVGTYMIPMGHFVQGEFDEGRFRHAADALVRRHDALRTRFEISGGKVHALVSPSPRFHCHVTRMADESFSAFRRWALPLVFDDVDPCEAGSLIRFLAADYGGRWRFAIAGHHAITDGVSRGVMNKELLELFCSQSLAPVGSYYDHALGSDDDVRLSEVMTQVEALPKPLRIVGDGSNDSARASTGEFVEIGFGPLEERVRAVAKDIGTTKFGFLAAVYALGLRGYMGDNSVSSFFQSAGRRSLDAPNTIVGPFSNTLPLNLAVDPEKSFTSFARDLLVRSREMLDLENTSLLDKVIAAEKAPSVSINMFPPETPIVAGDLVIGPREFLDRRTEFDLNLVWSEDGNALTARAFYNGAQITEQRARLFLGLQARLLEAALENPDRTCRELLAVAREGHLSVSPRQTLEPEPTGRLHQAFFDLAARSPEAPAIVTSSGQISYRDLADRARDIARGLEAAKVSTDDRVAIFAQRDPASVAAMLGVSAFGASFALIDASYPVARIRLILDRLDTRFVIEAGAELPPEIACEAVLVAPKPGSELARLQDGPPRNEAYHLFTSGTTGIPKLASHPDATLQRFVGWQARTLDLGEPIVTMMLAGLAHDPMMRDVFLPLSHGGRIAIPTPCEMADPAALRQLMRDAGCNVLRLSPSTARLLATGQTSQEHFGRLKAIFWGGERLPLSTVEQWRTTVPQARQFNVFGTTETPQAFLIHEITEVDRTRRDIPVGRSVPWCGARLVDEDHSPVSDGEVGQIVADLADPVIGVNRDGSGNAPQSAKVHYTGDLGFRTPEGEVYYAGRRDGQIKINGYRVELGEIETTVEALSGVERATAILAGERVHLFAQSSAPGISEKSLRSHLFRTLPAYMMPARIVVMETFPITPNGKVDREALMASMPGPGPDTEIPPTEAPQGDAEQAIAEVFSRHTTKAPGRDEALLDLGADSLSAIEARFELERRGFVLPDNWLWMTIRELADGHRPEPKASRFYSRLFQSSRTDMFIVLRSLAIFEVAAFHSGFRMLGGASIVLFALAGYSFAKMQLPAVLRDGHAGRVWALVLRLLVPMIPMTLVYYALYTYQGTPMHISALLFFRNIAELLDALGIYHGGEVRGIVWIWFLHTYLQIFALVGLALGLASVRSALSSDLWRSLAILFLASEALNLLTVCAVVMAQGDVLESARLLETSPTAIFPFLAVGALAAVADTTRKKLLTFLFAILQFAVCVFLFADHAEIWWIAALVLCVLVPYVSLPRVASQVIVAVAAYSLMIYLTHNAVFIVLYKFMGGSDVARAASIVVQIAAGVALGILLRPWIRSIESVLTNRRERLTQFRSSR